MSDHVVAPTAPSGWSGIGGGISVVDLAFVVVVGWKPSGSSIALVTRAIARGGLLDA